MWILLFVFFVFLNILSIFAPKRITRAEIYATTFFALTFGIVTDEILDLHYNLYGYFSKGFQWLGFIGAILFFIPINFLFLNFYPFHRGFHAKLIYTLLWALFSVVIEWLALKTEFFYHNGWKLWYSALVYPLAFHLLFVNLKIFQRLSR